LGIDWSRPTIGLLTNVMWDAELHYDARAFPSMIEWLTETISYFSGRPDLQLLVRIHPAEIRGTLPSRQPVMRELQKRFPQTAKNIFIIPPEARVSTYSAMSRCNAIIIYATKMGVEFSALGNHIIVAGEAWVRNKGITRDTISREDYFTALSQLPYISPPQPVVIDRAKKYAYHFFFRRMIPIEYFTPLKGNPPYGIALHHLDELRPGKSSGLDVICDGILKERDFIYPAERY
ncbi:MAG: capsular biosynthesis protein, partial [Deltaproteobacteria bacterium]|nr:capsular biosynthesis protein [Deltaproteobacteria bacterium]